MIDWRIVLRVAHGLARNTSVDDVDNLCGDMVLDVLIAVLHKKINAPTRRALLISRRSVMSRRRRHQEPLHQEPLHQEPLHQEPLHQAWCVHRLRVIWPTLTEIEQESVRAYLSGDTTCTCTTHTADNARRRVWHMMRGEHTRAPKHVTCGNRRR